MTSGRGLLFEGFLGADELAAAQEALWLHYPRPVEYFADPAAHAWLATSQWDGLIRGPWRSWDLNRLAFHPDLLDLAERFLGSADLRLYDAELWAKYAGAVDYDQRHHRDLGNHSLVVPKRSDPATQMTSWILLSDVGEEDGPTKVVPLSVGESVPHLPNTLDGSANDYVTNYLPAGAFADEEISVTGSAGTLFSFRTDIVHRGSRMTAERSARFTLLAHYDVWGPRWTGRVAWAAHSLSADWGEIIERATPRERSVFGFPAPGDPYWDEQTLADTQARYPRGRSHALPLRAPSDGGECLSERASQRHADLSPRADVIRQVTCALESAICSAPASTEQRPRTRRGLSGTG